MNTNWLSRLTHERILRARSCTTAGCIGVVALLLLTGFAAGQDKAPAASAPAAPVAPEQVVKEGFAVHQSADLGGHIVGVSGSGAMYDTLVNIHSGPRVLGQTYELRAVPGSKHALVDSLTAFTTGFGGDPYNFAKLDFSKGKTYEFTGIFRRDRQYFDYDLLGNPNVPGGQSIPYGLTAGVASAASVPWPQVNQSPVMFNTVRRMTDTNVTIFPLSKVSFRAGYSQNIFQGPSRTPGGYTIGKETQLLNEYQRNSSDNFIGAIDWKPTRLAKITFEEQVDHYKADSYFTLAPSDFIAQEADGTPVALGNWDSKTPTALLATCNTASMGSAYTSATTYTIFSAPQTAGGLPIINPACAVLTSYLRSQPTRIITPTEILRFQSSSIKNIALNGGVNYTRANSNLANYYENFQGLDGAIRSATYTGNTNAQRQVIGTEFGITWQTTKTFSLEDQVDFSNVHQPGLANISTGVTANTPTTAGNETINYNGPLLAGAGLAISGNPNGTPIANYFGQSLLTNNFTGSWEATPRTTLALTYRYRTHTIVQGAATGPASSVIQINENGGIFNAALRPTDRWQVNGTVEVLYDDNALTGIGPRQTKHYRMHTRYRIKPWATLSGAYNDLERHNNTYNTPSTYTGDGLLKHVDHSRIVSLGATLAPNEHYSVDVNYAFSDVYTSTNACYLSGASATVPGTASTTSSGAANVCPGVFTRGSTTVLSDWGPVKDFSIAPTHYGSLGVTYTPNKVIRTGAGYRISAVGGNQFFNDAQAVNGSLQSTYQTPYVNVAWTIHTGWVWRAEYKYSDYGEGGPSGAPFCSTSTSVTSTVVPCNSSSLVGPTGLTEPTSGLTAPRTFHASNLTLAMHYEF